MSEFDARLGKGVASYYIHPHACPALPTFRSWPDSSFWLPSRCCGL